MTNVKNMFTETLILCAADLISNGKISDGTSQPSGPHDHAKDITNRHVNRTTRIAAPFGSVFVSVNFTIRIIPIAVCNYLSVKD